ncbi:MAG: glycosyltransferase family 8 protein [Pirellulaceae bacterium]|nr:glycosyltransferase family 8 protein [Pirellulaceae bacterium]
MVENSDLEIVLAVDEAFCMPLCVTVRSVLKNLRKNYAARIWILHDMLTEPMKASVRDSVGDTSEGCTIRWLEVSKDSIPNATVDGHVSIVTFFRMLIGRYLPNEIQKVIYLDCDVLVRKDLRELFECDLQGKTIAAVQDSAAPFLDAKRMLHAHHPAIQHLGATRPIPNYQQLNLPASSPYFNAGVLLIDLKRWRENQVEQRLLDCISEHRENMIWWDQYALNVVLHDDWTMLDPTWNVTSHLTSLPSAKYSYLEKSTFDRIRCDPGVVHFSSSVKPWHPLCRNPFRGEFEAVLDKTAWAGTRPSIEDTVRASARAICSYPREALGKMWRTLNPWYKPLPHLA